LIGGSRSWGFKPLGIEKKLPVPSCSMFHQTHKDIYIYIYIYIYIKEKNKNKYFLRYFTLKIFFTREIFYTTPREVGGGGRQWLNLHLNQPHTTKFPNGLI